MARITEIVKFCEGEIELQRDRGREKVNKDEEKAAFTTISI